MKNLMILLMLFLFTNANAQTVKETHVDNSLSAVAGLYAFTFDGISHQIEINAENGTFKELDQQGAQLGNGTAYHENGIYVFVPVQSNQNCVIQTAIEVRIMEEIQGGVRVDVRYVGERTGRLLTLTNL